MGTPPLGFSCRLCPVSLHPPEGARRRLLFVFAEGSGCSCLWDVEPWGLRQDNMGRGGGCREEKRAVSLDWTSSQQERMRGEEGGREKGERE